jgi:hypothetical protein
MFIYNNHMKILIFSLITFFLVPALAIAIQLTPEQLNIGTMFNGQTITVSGEVAQEEEAVIQIIGTDTEAHFKQTGKVGGVLWMTVAHFSLSGAPSAYFVYLPKTISSWHQDKDKRWTELNLDYNVLQEKIVVEPEQKDEDVVFSDFLKLKTAHELYQMVDNGVSYKNTDNGNKEFIARIHIPADIPLEAYTVKVLKIKEDIIADTETAELLIQLKGFPLFISNMAYHRSLLYGILSVLIAIGAGIFMGMVFKDKGGAH